MRVLDCVLSALTIAFTVGALSAASNEGSVSGALQERVGEGLKPSSSDLADPQNLPPDVSLSDGLSEGEAVALALWNNAQLRATLSDLGLAQADLREAGLLVNPNFQMLAGVGLKPFEFLLIAPIEALWQRPKRVAAAKLNLESVGRQLVQNGLDLARDTRVAFADYRAVVRQSEAASELASLLEEIAELEARRLAAGDIGELDLELARIEALTSRDSAQAFEDEILVVWDRLRLLTGLPVAGPRVEPAEASEPPSRRVSLDELLEIASRSRPDVRAAELNVEAAGKRLGWQKTTTFAMVAPMLNTKGIGVDGGIKTGPGLAAEVPIFNRGQGRISRAEAELQQAVLRLAALREQTASETASASARLGQSQAALDRLRRRLIPAARKAFNLSESAYQAGDVSYLDLRRAERPLLELRLREYLAEAALQRAQAELDRAVGRNL